MKFNFKKYSQSASPASTPAPPTSTPAPTPPTQSGEILGELDNQASSQPQSNAAYKKYEKEVNKAYRQYEAESTTFEKLNGSLKQVKEGSPFAKVIPGSVKEACKVSGEMFNSFVTPEEIADIYQQYINSFQKLIGASQQTMNSWQKIIDEAQKDPALPNGTELFDTIEVKMNALTQEINAKKVDKVIQDRQFAQFDVLYGDMFNYYSLMTQICETKTQYDTQVEQFKMGSPDDFQALLSYYEYAISLLQTMAPKAAQIVPKNAGNVQKAYGNLIKEYQAEINKLSSGPLKALYGGG
jgi:hypothetical protein